MEVIRVGPNPVWLESYKKGKFGHPVRQAWREDDVRKHETAVYKSRQGARPGTHSLPTESSEGTKLTNRLLASGKDKCLIFKPFSLWHYALVAPSKLIHLLSLQTQKLHHLRVFTYSDSGLLTHILKQSNTRLMYKAKMFIH